MPIKFARTAMVHKYRINEGLGRIPRADYDREYGWRLWWKAGTIIMRNEIGKIEEPYGVKCSKSAR